MWPRARTRVGCAHLNGFPRHAKDHRRCLVLGDREGTSVPERKQASRTVPAHSGQKARGRLITVLFGKRFEKHIDRRSAGIPLGIGSEPEPSRARTTR